MACAGEEPAQDLARRPGAHHVDQAEWSLLGRGMRHRLGEGSRNAECPHGRRVGVDHAAGPVYDQDGGGVRVEQVPIHGFGVRRCEE